jgi:glyoxylase-like metal-dependent hydrolase (beta-lactamase superfamily II)
MTDLVQMEAPVRGLYASAPEPLAFNTSLHARAYLLRRDPGNLLIYSVSSLESEASEIQELGGISRQYLNHHHEAGLVSDWVTAPLFVHENERKPVEERAHVRGTFSRRHKLEDDFEVIPTPGHTSGATAYLWDTGEHRLLFTGDTIYLRDGEWVAAVLDSSERGPYLESLELIRELDFDVLVPWIASGEDPFYAVASHADARRRIDAIIERVRGGEDH